MKSPTASYTVQIVPLPGRQLLGRAGPVDLVTTAQSSMSTQPSRGDLWCSADRLVDQPADDVYTNAGATDSQTVKVAVQPPGGNLSCKALDNAGTCRHRSRRTPDRRRTADGEPWQPTAASDARRRSGRRRGVRRVRRADRDPNGRRMAAAADRLSAGSRDGRHDDPDDGSIADSTYDLQAHVRTSPATRRRSRRGSGHAGGRDAAAADRHATRDRAAHRRALPGCARICARRQHATATPP